MNGLQKIISRKTVRKIVRICMSKTNLNICLSLMFTATNFYLKQKKEIVLRGFFDWKSIWESFALAKVMYHPRCIISMYVPTRLEHKTIIILWSFRISFPLKNITNFNYLKCHELKTYHYHAIPWTFINCSIPWIANFAWAISYFHDFLCIKLLSL